MRTHPVPIMCPSPPSNSVEKHLPTPLNLPAPPLRRPPSPNFIPDLPPLLLRRPQPEDLRHIPHLAARRGRVVAVEIDLAEEEDVFAAHEVGPAWDVAVQRPRARLSVNVCWGVGFGAGMGACGGGGVGGGDDDEKALDGRGQDQVGELVPAAQDAEEFAAVAQDQDEFLVRQVEELGCRGEHLRRELRGPLRLGGGRGSAILGVGWVLWLRLWRVGGRVVQGELIH